jgi:hypothetical protein
MHDHIHLILTPNGITLERAIQFVKGGFSFELDPVPQRLKPISLSALPQA